MAAYPEPTVAVSILSGFLGSGKTTLLNRLLHEPDMADAAVIINEFGDVPLDHLFVDRPKDDIAVLANGCLCCLARDGLEDALVRITTKARPDGAALSRIFIETSGLADPAPILQLILDLPSAAGRLVLDQVIVTVDAEHIGEQAKQHYESRKQLALADMLVFTKADRIDEAMIGRGRRAALRYNRAASHRLAREGTIETADLPPLEVEGAVDDHGHHCAGEECDHGSHVTSITLAGETPLDWDAFSRWFRRFRRERGERLLRAKGILRLSGETCPMAFDAVHHIAYPCRPMPDLSWPQALSRLVLIMQDTPASEIEGAWTEFQADIEPAGANA